MLTVLIPQSNGRRFWKGYNMEENVKELRRLSRTIDMMLTMHAVLRDKFKNRATLVDVVLMIASSLMLFISIANPSIISYFGLSIDDISVLAKICSVAIFLLSLVILRVDWKEKATKHERACEALARLKSETRAVLLKENSAIENGSKHQQLCSLTMNNLWPIPENQFHKLKALHIRKIELSKLISSHPGCPLWVLKIYLFFQSIFAACRKNENKSKIQIEQIIDE